MGNERDLNKERIRESNQESQNFYIFCHMYHHYFCHMCSTHTDTHTHDLEMKEGLVWGEGLHPET